ncbi:MAG: aryl-sulfate sulfohydrolase [Bacteroidetes bacterium]|nr:MAG: aryl-sulfate sulfohydrolase [Bacteroidota bacterium]
MKIRSIHFILSLLLISLSCNKPQENTPPNIILINIDDMGWKDTGFQGSQFYETPNIDKIADQGFIFTNGYAAASNCAPSRACLMTGLWTSRHGVYTVSPSARGKSEHRKLIPTKNTKTLPEEFITLPEILNQNGYSTCHAGKWHLSDDPLTRGFDKNIGGGHNGHPKSYYPPYKNVDLEAENGEYLTDLIMTQTIAFVRSAKQPFFLNYAPYAVHTPIHPVDSLKAKYEEKAPWNGQQNVDYATMVDNLDRNIGRLIKTLNELNFSENTLIIFTSDNGGLWGITDQQPLRAGKGSYYEGGIRVPFFFYWPEKIPSKTATDIPITNLDILPTILEAAGIKYDQKLDGESLWSAFTGDTTLQNRPLFWHFPIYLEAYRKNNLQNRDTLFRTRPGSVVRSGDWKLHHYFEDNGIELYNLKADISESQNLASQKPEKINELIKILNSWRDNVNAPIPDQLNPDYKE